MTSVLRAHRLGRIVFKNLVVPSNAGEAANRAREIDHRKDESLNWPEAVWRTVRVAPGFWWRWPTTSLLATVGNVDGRSELSLADSPGGQDEAACPVLAGSGES
jgi:hypothetical protein